jgi:flagellar hook-length control protein FliK
MNAAPPVFQAQPVSDAVQPGTPASAASASTRPGSQDFAAALSDAGGKPVRKNAANKQPGSSAGGSSLPAPGNQPPVALTPPPPAKTDVSATLVADAAAVVRASSGSAQGPLPGAIAAASSAAANAGGMTTTLTAENLAAPLATAAPVAPAAAPATPVPPAPAALPASAALLASANSPATAGVAATTSGSGPTMPHAAGMRTLAAPGSPTGVTAPAKSSDAATNQGTIASGTSAPSSAHAAAPSDSTLSNGPAAAAGADAAAQAAMAAAIAQGTNAPAPNSAFADDVSPADTDLPSGAAAVSGPAAGAPADGAPAAALAQASAAAISAAMTAAAAASAAQVVSAAASTSAADKRTHGNSPDSTLSGASNDGSVGAAQLMTSNIPTDSAQTPTFKVAAGVDTAQFSQGVADRVSLMMDGNLTSAKLQVNPPALGPIEVRIALQGGHAQVSFSSHSAVTRDALESSSEKLREMLGSQGFSSVSVDISQRSFQERSPQSQAYEAGPASSADAPAVAHASLSMPRSASGMLDAYA